MTHLPSTRIPVNDSYALLLGKAVYVFAYYEWAIICIIEQLDKGFASRYSRGKIMVSSKVREKMHEVINRQPTRFDKVLQVELQACCEEFKNLIDKRNDLIHAHPITEADTSQILLYQAGPAKNFLDVKWPAPEVEAIIQKFDAAACAALILLDRLR